MNPMRAGSLLFRSARQRAERFMMTVCGEVDIRGSCHKLGFDGACVEVRLVHVAPGESA